MREHLKAIAADFTQFAEMDFRHDEGRVLRPAIHRLVSAQTGGLPVLSYLEVTSANVAIETVGVVRGTETISA